MKHPAFQSFAFLRRDRQPPYAPDAAIAPAPHSHVLRLCLPQFPLEVLLRGVDPAQPVARCADPRQSVSHSNAAAARLGIRPGMDPRAARTLCPDLVLLAPDPGAEAQARAFLLQWFALLGLDAVPQGHDFLLGVGSDWNVAVLRARLRRELRALGYLARLDDARPDAGLPVTGRPLSPVFSSVLGLPWDLGRPRALDPALACLLAELRAVTSAAGREVAWIQFTLGSADGSRGLHRFDLMAGQAPEDAVRHLRARLLRDPPRPIRAVGLEAGFVARGHSGDGGLAH